MSKDLGVLVHAVLSQCGIVVGLSDGDSGSKPQSSVKLMG